MDAAALDAFVRAMPKTDLHYHLEGGVRPETLAQIARRRGLPPEECDPAYIRARLEVSPSCASLSEFLTRFDYVTPLLQTPWALETAAEAAVREAAEQNAIYLEVRFAPAFLRTEEMDAETAIRAVLRGLEAGERRWGVIANAIVILGLATPVEENLALVGALTRLSLPRVVGVDVAGPEAELSFEAQAPALRAAAEAGLAITIHAGEAGPPSHIAAALALGAARIGHATSLSRDSALLARVAALGVGLELCPTSNVQTRAVPGWEAYPLPALLAAGANVTLCTDDPAISGITLTGEYLSAARRFGLTPAQLLDMTRRGVGMSFAAKAQKAKLLARLDRFRP